MYLRPPYLTQIFSCTCLRLRPAFRPRNVRDMLSSHQLVMVGEIHAASQDLRARLHDDDDPS